MSSSPNYRYNRNPQITVNHLAAYLSTTNASQRRNLIREAKFPRKIQVVTYQQIMPSIKKFLSSNSGNLADFDVLESKLHRAIERETGWHKDEATRCFKALQAFKSTYTKRRLGMNQYGPGADVLLAVGALPVKIGLAATIRQRDRDNVMRSGGVMLYTASSAQSRRNIEQRMKDVTQIVRWGLESANRNIDPQPRLCIAIDLFDENIVRAPDAFERFRERTEDSAQEIVARWDDIEPPEGYDGPTPR